MGLDRILMSWILVTLFFSLWIGGVPWLFPQKGRYWLQDHKDRFNSIEEPLNVGSDPSRTLQRTTGVRWSGR